MNKPLISIIIPAFNSSEYIMETLESVKSQTYKNYEIILVNDCSSDNTNELIDLFSKNISNSIKLITNDINSGIVFSRNLAVANASGTWLALIDSDDIWLPNHLEMLVNVVNLNLNIDVVYTGCLVFLNNINNIIFKQRITEKMLINFNVSLFTHQIGINPCSVFLKKVSWDIINGMDNKLNGASDKDLFLRLAKVGSIFKFSEHHTALYRKHSNKSAVSNNYIKMALENIYIYEKHSDWKDIPYKIRNNELSNAYLSYARLIKNNDINAATQYSLKALKINKSLNIVTYFIVFKILSMLR
jgi:glycosyltransferase involved in cell wall biosynthesis